MKGIVAVGAVVVVGLWPGALAFAQAADPPVAPPATPAAAPPGMQPAVAPVAGPALRHGFTLELDLGVGFANLHSGGESTTSDAALAGLDLGLGGWLAPRLNLMFRIAGLYVDYGGSSAEVIHDFAGPSVQYWIDRHFWVGGGAGLALYHLTNDGCSIGNESSTCGVQGFGLDARAGYSVFSGNQSVNVSVEITPGFYSSDGSSATVLGFALLVGYQYL